MTHLRRITITVATAGLIFVVVLGLFTGVFAVTGRAPAAIVIAPGWSEPSHLPDGVNILKWGKIFVTVTGDDPDLVVNLYKAGALLVLPMRRNGCLAYRPAPSV